MIMRSADAIVADVLALPPSERAAVVLRLVESLDSATDEDAADAWAEEVTARVEALRSGTADTLSASEALAEARARLSARRA
jgi:putative addiction module component (TIGR02574 family)